MEMERFHGTNETIERMAQSLRTRLGIAAGERLGDSPRLRELVEKTGGQIVISDSPSAYEAEGGSLVIRGPHEYTIYLSPFTTSLRDNFTIAHEVGHFVLHYVPRREQLHEALPLRFARYGTGPVEWQANRFAAALLMPNDEFRAEFHRAGGDMYLVAGRFGVSVSAAENRCKSLGLLQPV